MYPHEPSKVIEVLDTSDSLSPEDLQLFLYEIAVILSGGIEEVEIG